MERQHIKNLVHRYYEAWASQQQEQVRRLLRDDLIFRSPQDRFDSADVFLGKCWRYSEGLAGVRFLREIYDGDQAFVILEWSSADGTRFADAEYVRVDGEGIAEILVVANDPSFGQQVIY
jgi:hypothetical protein